MQIAVATAIQLQSNCNLKAPEQGMIFSEKTSLKAESKRIQKKTNIRARDAILNHSVRSSDSYEAAPVQCRIPTVGGHVNHK